MCPPQIVAVRDRTGLRTRAGASETGAPALLQANLRRCGVVPLVGPRAAGGHRRRLLLAASEGLAQPAGTGAGGALGAAPVCAMLGRLSGQLVRGHRLHPVLVEEP